MAGPARYVRAVIRLMGLPSAARAPQVRVERTGETLALWFLGAPGEPPVTRIDVPPYALEGDDVETAMLELMADLQGRGYDVARAGPPI